MKRSVTEDDKSYPGREEGGGWSGEGEGVTVKPPAKLIYRGANTLHIYVRPVLCRDTHLHLNVWLRVTALRALARLEAAVAIRLDALEAALGGRPQPRHGGQAPGARSAASVALFADPGQCGPQPVSRPQLLQSSKE